LLVKQEETAVTETEETVETDLKEVKDGTDLKEVEVHHQETSASSAEELAIGKNQFNNKTHHLVLDRFDERGGIVDGIGWIWRQDFSEFTKKVGGLILEMVTDHSL
jgi:hypothetical protein